MKHNINVEELWITYRDQAYQDGLGQHEEKHIKHGFYAGAALATSLVRYLTERPDNEVHELLKEFVRQIEDHAGIDEKDRYDG